MHGIGRYVREHVAYIWSPLKYFLPKGWKIENKKGIKEECCNILKKQWGKVYKQWLYTWLLWINPLGVIHIYYFIILCFEQLELYTGDHTDFIIINLIVERVRKLFKTRYCKQADYCKFIDTYHWVIHFICIA